MTRTPSLRSETTTSHENVSSVPTMSSWQIGMPQARESQRLLFEIRWRIDACSTRTFWILRIAVPSSSIPPGLVTSRTNCAVSPTRRYGSWSSRWLKFRTLTPG